MPKKSLISTVKNGISCTIKNLHGKSRQTKLLTTNDLSEKYQANNIIIDQVNDNNILTVDELHKKNKEPLSILVDKENFNFSIVEKPCDNNLLDQNLTCSSQHVEHVKIIKKTRQKYVWRVIESFEHESSAKAKIPSNKWQYSRQQGNCIYYKCFINKFCKSRLRVRCFEENKVFTEADNIPHDHSQTDNKVRGIEDDSKAYIKKIYESGIRRPSTILDALERSGLKVPKLVQLNNFLKQIRRKA